MLRKPKKQPQTVAEKVSKLLEHPNDSESDDNSDIDVATAARVVDFEDDYDLPDARSTDFRKRNVKLLSEQSERYKGKISSRKELEEEDEEEEDESDDDEEQGEAEESGDEDEELPYEESDTDEEEAASMEAFSKKLKAVNKTKSTVNGNESEQDEDDDEEDNKEQEDEDEDDEEDDDDGDDDDSDEGDSDDADSEDDAIDTSEIMTKTNQQAEIQKGLCVQNQLKIWERLLELRINTQKVSSKVNQLPPPETLQRISSQNEELETVLKEAQERSSKLLQQLLALQSALTQQNSELRQAVKRKQPSEQKSTEPASKRFSHALENNFQNMRSYRNEVLLKWDDRTKLLTPGAGVKRKSLQEDYDIIKKIDNALANRDALLEKSQTLKNNEQQQRVEKEQKESPEESSTGQSQRQPHIYDDSDFYHQQLRELIEYKASSTSNISDITKQFVELQKLRQKMKKKVDTRASKGRKLRYVVHKKLINFMACDEDNHWTEASKTELYKSLFV